MFNGRRAAGRPAGEMGSDEKLRRAVMGGFISISHANHEGPGVVSSRGRRVRPQSYSPDRGGPSLALGGREGDKENALVRLGRPAG